ncbi:MFS transporter [Labrys monachus]|uniref:MFS family permease n=1 Tax=Labrys monachus TaxID=217067 RepID=A0ABU0FP00_9HYPH|nr:MFS transporter [Labrys monachus]MDQ0396343.1 MFS family permease [Labrys monachus]
MTGVALAMAYGSSFLLSDALSAAGHAASTAGAVISVGTVATLVGSLFAGRLAERTGILPLVAASASIMAIAMACFAMIGTGGLPLAYAGGLSLGLGWAIFYMLAPIQLIHCLKPSARLEALTLLSGSQMLGIGMSAPLGHAIADHFGGPAKAYAFYACVCALVAAFSLLIRRRMADQPQLPMRAVALTVPATLSILRARTVAPVIMIGIAACTFAGLSTFQSLYAGSRGLAPDIFFLTFTVTTVALRFSVASMIGRIPLGRLGLALFIATLLGIGLLLINAGSSILYVVATILFATGYGLTYSTLNAMVVNLAGECGLSVPVASQVFTLGYFIGLFGFPYFAGSLIAAYGIDSALIAMAGLVAANIASLGWSLRKANTESTHPNRS